MIEFHIDSFDIDFVCFGAVTEKFSSIANLKKELNKIKTGAVAPVRVDCYPYTIGNMIYNKFKNIGLDIPQEGEIFYPSEVYPPHIDGEGFSYFIPLESGNFTIDGVVYPIVPFVLYGFDDRKLHNTDFCAIMLR